MGQRERNDSGRFTETVTPERVLAVLAERADPVATAGDIAEALDCTGEAARQKLVALHEDGRVERRKVGGAAVVWWLVDEERARGGSPEPLFGLVGLFDGDEEAARRARERSEEWGKAFDRQMMSGVEDDETGTDGGAPESNGRA